MMPQQINLYQFLPKMAKPKLNLQIMLFICGIFFLFLMIPFFMHLWEKHNKLKYLNQLSLKTQTEQVRLAEFVKKYSIANPKDLETSVKYLQQELQANKKILNALLVENKFSAYLKAFSESITPDVWLTQMIFVEGGEQISVRGNALLAASVQQFLNRLQSNIVFTNKPLEIKELQKMASQDKTKQYFNFNISTKTKLS